MGTNNFHNENASKVFPVLMDNEVSEFDYDDLVENVASRMRRVFGNNFHTYLLGTSPSDELRSFHADIIGTVTAVKEYKKIDAELEMNIHIVIRSGYYQGGNLDYCLEIKENGEYLDWDQDFDLGYNSMSKEQAYQYELYATAWKDKTERKLTDKIEKIFTEFSRPLNHVGSFSNGEAIYEPVEDK